MSQPGEINFARPFRGLGLGEHRFLTLLPVALDSPAVRLIETNAFPVSFLMKRARIWLLAKEGFCWIDETVPCIVLTQHYYQNGNDLDLYLDLLHELTHIRQIFEGRDVWEEKIPYHRRPTEIEGYAVAVAEGRRLGMDELAIIKHLSNPWMTTDQVAELLKSVNNFLAESGRL